MKCKKENYIRRIIQAACFLLLPSMFIEVFNSIKAIILFAFYGQGTVNTVMPKLLLLAGVTVLTAVFGRFFCGWICSFGSAGDLIYKLAHFKQKPKETKILLADNWLKWLKYVLLAVITVAIWGFGIITVKAGVNPWEAFGMLTSFSKLSAAKDVINGFAVGAVILIVIAVGSAFIERFFCRYLCPLGAYLAIVSKISPMNIVKDNSQCGSCHLCSMKCTMGIPLDETDKVKGGECIQCLECERVCPKENARLSFGKMKINSVVAGIIASLLLVGVYSGLNLYEANASKDTGNMPAVNDTIKGLAKDKADGTYTGSAKGYAGTTTVAVEVKDGQITKIEVVSSNDDKNYLQSAVSGVVPEIIKGQTADVDTVSGATYSSKGIINAVKNALENGTDNTAETTQAQTEDKGTTDNTAGSLSNLKDGTYKGKGQGYRGEVEVTVTVKNGKVSDISIDSYVDDDKFFERASEEIVNSIIQKQSVNVDAVSGATYSSNGIKEAVANALNQEFIPSETTGGKHEHKGKGKNRNNFYGEELR